jgi:hypothetical protein
MRWRTDGLGAGGARQARYLSCFAKKGNPKKATRTSRPALRSGCPVLLESCGGCGTRKVLRPLLKQSSPTTPQLSAMLGAPYGT